MRAVLFDFDGTLARLNIDFAQMGRLVHERIRHWGVDPGGLKGAYLLERIEEAVSALGPRGKGLRREAHELVVRVEMAAAARGALFPGVRPLMRALRRDGIKLAVLTRNCRKAVLAVSPEIEAFCDALVPRDGLARVKPHPDHPKRCLELINADASEALMVGDHAIDICTGRSLGMLTAGVLTGGASREMLEAAGADYVLESVIQLAPMLGLDTGKTGPRHAP